MANGSSSSNVAVPFTVTNQVITTAPGRTGVYVRGYTVHAQLQSGTPIEVFIPMDEYNVANVRTVLQAKANEVAAVERIGH